MEFLLPTQKNVNADWVITGLLDSIRHELAHDERKSELKLYAYAITSSGWDVIRSSIDGWQRKDTHRKVIAYVGTDHGLTEPDALRNMRSMGVSVHLLSEYDGIFHPKVMWLSSEGDNLIWSGSNNFTRDGLQANIEFATLVRCKAIPSIFQSWCDGIHRSSLALDEESLNSYSKERAAYAKKRAELGNFTWSRRSKPRRSPAGKGSLPAAGAGSSRGRAFDPNDFDGQLVMEIMDRETSSGGQQIQIPKAAAIRFFGLRDRVGASKRLRLTDGDSGDTRNLTMTMFGNRTTRLTVNNLHFEDRPCVMVFEKRGPDTFGYRIIKKAVFPELFHGLITASGRKSRQGSRRWTVL